MQSLDLLRDSQAQKQRVFAMAETGIFKRVARVISLVTFSLLACAAFATGAQAADVVTTFKDESGWRLQVNGEDYYVKGVVWSYTPRGENYSYNLWGESDEFIRKVLDYDFGLMRKAGVNTIRSFAMIPPKWVTYIYREHGIMSVINPLVGRYGSVISGRWTPITDYSDELTRATLKADSLAVVETYKDVPGVLMFAFGNENNYGLSWSSFEIENLPVGEQNTAKARYLYSLFNEIISSGKRISQSSLHDRQRGHPVHRPDRGARARAGPDRQQRLPRQELHRPVEPGRREARSAGAVLRIRQRCL
jgi:beta-galactosidase